MIAARLTAAGLLGTLVLLAGAATTTVHAQDNARLAISADAETRELLRRAERRLAAGDSDGVYRMLTEREASLAGNPYFDYLLGVAALDSGHSSEAIFSLQRALAVEPGFSGARLELARAYFDTGDTGQARPLFVALLNEDPPPGVRRVLSNYIAAIDARPDTSPSRLQPYAEFVIGYDSNANGSTDDQQFLGFTLNPDNIETDSGFAELAAGFNFSAPRSQPPGRQFAWFAGGRLNHRHNPDASFVDATIVSGLGGFNWRNGDFYGRANLDGYLAWRDGESNENYGGVDLNVGRRLNAEWELTLGLRGGALRHDDAIEILDVDRVLYTLGASYRLADVGSVHIEAIGGQDSEKQSGSSYGNSKAGGRISLLAPVGDAYLYASVGSLRSDYDGLFFGAAREDTQLTSILQIEFRDVWTEGLSLIPRLRYVDNDSDIDLYKYDRSEIGLVIRWIPR